MDRAWGRYLKAALGEDHQPQLANNLQTQTIEAFLLKNYILLIIMVSFNF